MTRDRLVGYAIALFAAVGLLIWQASTGLWPRTRTSPPVRHPRAAAACPSGKPELTAACVAGTGGEVVVAPCDGSAALRLAPIPGGEWGTLQTAPLGFSETMGWDGRLATMRNSGKDPGSWIQVGVPYLPKRPVGARHGYLQVETAQGPVCPGLFRGDYQVISFPDASTPELPLVLAFRGVCAKKGAIVSGCLRYEPPRPIPESESDAETADEESAEPSGDPEAGSSGEPAQDSGASVTMSEAPSPPPLDGLPACNGPHPVPVSHRPRRPGPLEWLGARIPDRGEDPIHSHLPSAMDTAALARRYLKEVDLDAGLGPKWRREMAKRQRENEAASDGDDPPPTALTFDIPASEVSGHLYLFGAKGPVPVEPRGATGAVYFFVDENGCEREREFFGAVRVAVREEGVLVWSPEPVAFGTPRKLVLGKDLSIREVPATADEHASYEVTLKLGERRIRGRADTAQFASAYLVQAGDQTILWVDWTGRPIDAVSCEGVTVYAVGEELEAVDGLVRGVCM